MSESLRNDGRIWVPKKKEDAKKDAEDPFLGRESALPSFQNVCVDPNYTRVTLKTATESTMVALFDDLHGEKKFEASDVIPVGHNFLVVFDNSFRSQTRRNAST